MSFDWTSFNASREWAALVTDASTAVTAWLEDMNLTPAEWAHILGADHVVLTEYPGWDADDFKTSFAQRVFDDGPTADDLAPSIVDAFLRLVDEEQGEDYYSDPTERRVRAAERAWLDAVDEAEDALAKAHA